MNVADRVVINIRLEKLWNAQGEIEAERVSYLSKIELKQLLRDGTVQFVLADLGQKLIWIEQQECFSFWKNELEPHLIENREAIHLDEFPEEYAYLASEWRGKIDMPIVLLEKIH